MTKLFPDELGRYDRGVHLPLIRALGDTSTVRVVVVDRYSKEDAYSMDSQVERHLALHPNDLDAREYRRMIEDGMFAEVGRALFLRMQLSTAQQQINRENGSQA